MMVTKSFMFTESTSLSFGHLIIVQSTQFDLLIRYFVCFGQKHSNNVHQHLIYSGEDILKTIFKAIKTIPNLYFRKVY